MPALQATNNQRTASRVQLSFNRPGHGWRVAWLGTLPNLALRKAYCWGRPVPAVWHTLTQLAQEVCQLEESSLVTGYLLNEHDLKRTPSPPLGSELEGSKLAEPTDLLYLAQPLPSSATARHAFERWMEAFLQKGGLVYGDGDIGDRLSASTSHVVRQALRLGNRGDATYALPADDHSLWQQMEQEVRPSDWRQFARKLWRRLKHFGLRQERSDNLPTQGTLWYRQDDQRPGPPQFLQQIALAHGVSLTDFHWAFVANASYPSRKLLYHLVDPQTHEQQYVVKMTQAPPFNARLNRERQALQALDRLSLESSVVTPKVCFWGEHAERTVLGESYMNGVPCDTLTTLTPGSSAVDTVVDWCTQLAQQTAVCGDESGDPKLRSLRDLLPAFLETYRPTSTVSDYLQSQVDYLVAHSHLLPRVMTHGDLGRWNLLQRPADKRLVVLDWESYEREGMPGWDVFYFLRSVMIGAARRHSLRDRVKILQDGFLSSKSRHASITDALRQYWNRLYLPAELLEPLFVTCWMHRSMKEATRVAPERLASAHYYRWLQAVIAHRSELAFLSSQLGSPAPVNQRV